MQHWITIHARPAQDSRPSYQYDPVFLGSYPVSGYRHRISSMGWYDTASCTILANSRAAADLFLEQHLGAFVKVYADNPAMPCWEGLINRITTGDYTVSLDELANRVAVQYSLNATPTTNAKTSVSNDTDSQGVYGIKADTLEFGLATSTSDTRMNNLRDATLAARAWPQKSFMGGEQGTIQIEMVGIFHTLEWETYSYSASGTPSYSTWLTATLMPAIANGVTFFDNTITTSITTNASVRTYPERGERSIWEILTKMAEAGDGTIPWIIGIEPSRYSDGKRALYYRAANTDIEYTAHLNDGARPRNLFGKIIDPWDVRPDRGIRITDSLLGWSGLGDDPTETYIAQIEYDADSQSVRWSGFDNTEAEAAFQLHHTSKSTAKRFGAPPRVTSV